LNKSTTNLHTLAADVTRLA